MSVLTYPTNYHVKMLAESRCRNWSNEPRSEKRYSDHIRIVKPRGRRLITLHYSHEQSKQILKQKSWFTCTVWFESLLFTQAGICLFPRHVSNDIRRKAQVGGWVGISRVLCIVFYQYLQIVNNGLRCICKIIIYTRIKYFQTDNSKIPVQRSFG